MGCCVPQSFQSIEIVPHSGASASAGEKESEKESASESEKEIDPPPDFDRMLEEAAKRRPSPKYAFRRQNRMVFE